jgi:hypothetical protein
MPEPELKLVRVLEPEPEPQPEPEPEPESEPELYYYEGPDEENVQVTAGELRALLRSGAIESSTLIWAESLGEDWVPLGDAVKMGKDLIDAQVVDEPLVAPSESEPQADEPPVAPSESEPHSPRSDATDGSPRFFDELDAWIGKAPTVLTHSHGEEALKQRLTILAKRASWESVAFAGFDEDGSGELDAEEFAQMARHKMGVAAGELSDDMLEQLFRRIDTRGSGTIDAATLKQYLLDDELRRKVRVASSVVDWGAAFAELADGGQNSSSDECRLDIHEFFVVVRTVEHRQNSDRKDGVLALKMKDDEVIALFRAADARGLGTVCVKDLDDFLTGSAARTAQVANALAAVDDSNSPRSISPRSDASDNAVSIHSVSEAVPPLEDLGDLSDMYGSSRQLQGAWTKAAQTQPLEHISQTCFDLSWRGYQVEAKLRAEIVELTQSHAAAMKKAEVSRLEAVKNASEAAARSARGTESALLAEFGQHKETQAAATKRILESLNAKHRRQTEAAAQQAQRKMERAQSEFHREIEELRESHALTLRAELDHKQLITADIIQLQEQNASLQGQLEAEIFAKETAQAQHEELAEAIEIERADMGSRQQQAVADNMDLQMQIDELQTASRLSLGAADTAWTATAQLRTELAESAESHSHKLDVMSGEHAAAMKRLADDLEAKHAVALKAMSVSLVTASEAAAERKWEAEAALRVEMVQHQESHVAAVRTASTLRDDLATAVATHASEIASLQEQSAATGREHAAELAALRNEMATQASAHEVHIATLANEKGEELSALFDEVAAQAAAHQTHVETLSEEAGSRFAQLHEEHRAEKENYLQAAAVAESELASAITTSSELAAAVNNAHVEEIEAWEERSIATAQEHASELAALHSAMAAAQSEAAEAHTTERQGDSLAVEKLVAEHAVEKAKLQKQHAAVLAAKDTAAQCLVDGSAGASQDHAAELAALRSDLLTQATEHQEYTDALSMKMEEIAQVRNRRHFSLALS